MATYPPAVERWRPIVAKYFPPELVDKALYVISHESKGNPSAVGDGGAARGLFQIQDNRNFASRPDAAYLDNPENNIKYAAQALGAARGNWKDWGEGTENMAPYDPKTGKGRFGALGNNPYQGGGNAVNGRAPMATTIEGEGGGGAGGGDTNSSEYQRQRKALSDEVSRAIAYYQQHPDDTNGPYLISQAVDNLAKFDGAAGNKATLGDTKAQQAFQNALSLGDFSLKYAQAGWGRYTDKAQLARDAASAELADIQKKNAAIGDTFDLEKKTGVLSGGNTAYTMAPTYDEALAKWQKQFGVGEQPAMPDKPDITAPDFTNGGDTGGGYAEPAPYDDTMAPPDSFNPGNPWNDRKPKDEGGTWGAGNGEHGPYLDIPGVRIEPFGGGTAFNPGGGWSNGEDYPFQNFWQETRNGQDYPFQNAAGDVANAAKSLWGFAGSSVGAGNAGGIVSGAKKKAKNWWNTMSDPGSWKLGIPSHATGTAFHQGGPALVNEQGPEMRLPAAGGPPEMMPGGPHVANLDQGDAIIPANVPPQEAFQYSQIRQAAAQPAQNPALSPAAQQMRANDPQLEQRVMAAIYKAIVGIDATHETMTPTFDGTSPDPWAHRRTLSGIPADRAQAAEVMKQREKAAR